MDISTPTLKREGKGRYIITRVFFTLTNSDHHLNTTYGAIEEELNKMGVPASVKNISQAVINIRSSNLPDPGRELAIAGSFFKNPVVSDEHYQELKRKYPELVATAVLRDL
ncbi:MAG: hypothetical protein U5L96_05230 [Owenweeksia sp.]|nr:hypothetical protein [Owenweeksia sp.]